LLAPLDDPYTRIAVSAERVFLATIGGGCAVPLGAYAQLQGDEIAIAGMIGTPDGQVVTAALTGPLETAADLGRQLAETLLASGGRDFLTPDEEQAHA
jgi:hydroxymethylbilane synthase